MSRPPTATAADTRALTAAFVQFNELSAGLTDAYRQLEARVAELNTQLASSRHARLNERVEKERLADRLTGLLEMLPAAVVLVDGRDRIDRFNRTAEALLPNLAWGRRWAEVLREQLVVGAVDDPEWLLAQGRRVSVTVRELSDLGRILVLVDVTERRSLEERLQRRERLSAMGEMAAQLAHQVRTPLSAAVLYGGQLAGPLEPAQRRRFGAKLLARLRHTEQLVADMLAFARGARYLPEPVDLRRVVRDAVDTVMPRLGTAAVEVLPSVPADTAAVRVLGNRDALTGAVVNLLNNALDHGGAAVRVRVGLQGDADHWTVQVRDDGPGIAPDARQRLFDPFFTTREGGTGLGLAVVQAVVLEHGGSVHCDDAGPGAGFAIVLPRLADAAIVNGRQPE